MTINDLVFESFSTELFERLWQPSAGGGYSQVARSGSPTQRPSNINQRSQTQNIYRNPAASPTPTGQLPQMGFRMK